MTEPSTTSPERPRENNGPPTIASGLVLVAVGAVLFAGQLAGDLRNGTWGLLGGLAILAVGFLFFEGVIGIGGDRLALPEWLLPVPVIGIGVVVLLRGVLERREA